MIEIEWGQATPDTRWRGARRPMKRTIEIRNGPATKMGVNLLIIISPVATHPKYGARRYARRNDDKTNWSLLTTMSMNSTALITPEILEELAEVIRQGKQEILKMLQIWHLEGKGRYYNTLHSI